MPAKDIAIQNLNRIAETHFLLKPVLEDALKKQVLTDDGRRLANTTASNYHEYWIAMLNDKFFDMGTLVRLGTELENTLKYYYMEKMGHGNLVQLKADPAYKLNIFQRLLPWTQQSAIDLYNSALNIDLNANPFFSNMQELMLYRHLYAHNSGLLNEKFTDDYRTLIGIDLLQKPDLHSYPQQDTYYFEPLSRLHEFIENARRFINALP